MLIKNVVENWCRQCSLLKVKLARMQWMHYWPSLSQLLHQEEQVSGSIKVLITAFFSHCSTVSLYTVVY